MAFRANTVAAMHGEQPLLRGLFDSGRKVLAGMLLILPGILSDVMALALLALRFNLGRGVRAAARRPEISAAATSRSTANTAGSTDFARRSRRPPTYFIRSSTVGSALSARRYAWRSIAAPMTIIGSDSHCPS
jgi:hypothetical protein